MWVSLLQGFSYAAAPLSSFGPFKIFILSSALRNGWRRSLPLALTPLVADIPVILLLFLVLRQLPGWSINVLRVIGAFFYIYLAVGLYRRAQAPVDQEALAADSRISFWQAITAIWITPQAYINWSTIGIPAILGYAELSILHVASFLGGFYLVFVLGLAVQIILLGQAGKINKNITKYIIYAAAVVLVGFAIYQFWIGLGSLLSL